MYKFIFNCSSLVYPLPPFFPVCILNYLIHKSEVRLIFLVFLIYIKNPEQDGKNFIY